MLSFRKIANELLLLVTHIVTPNMIAKVIAEQIDTDSLRSTGMDTSHLSNDLRSRIAPPSGRSKKSQREFDSPPLHQ